MRGAAYDQVTGRPADSRPDLRERTRALAPGHPSSPWNEDGRPRSPERPLSEYEVPEPPLTDAEYAGHVRHVETTLDKARAAGLATHLQFTVDPDRGIWTKERAALHDEIIESAYAAAADVPCERQAILAGGPGGAGKTTVLAKYAGVERSAYLTINPDEFKEELARRGVLPKLPALSPIEVSSLAHEESSYLARQLARRALDDGKNMIWDITMSSTNTSERRLLELRSFGYERVGGLFVHIPIEVSMARMLSRHRHGHDLFLAGQGLGGRHVPVEVYRTQYDSEYGSANRRAFEALKPNFSHWALFDNSVDGRPPTLVQAHGWYGLEGTALRGQGPDA